MQRIALLWTNIKWGLGFGLESEVEDEGEEPLLGHLGPWDGRRGYGAGRGEKVDRFCAHLYAYSCLKGSVPLRKAKAKVPEVVKRMCGEKINL